MPRPGAAHLREMIDRVGSEGFLADYNAGPKRARNTWPPLPASGRNPDLRRQTRTVDRHFAAQARDSGRRTGRHRYSGKAISRVKAAIGCDCC
jgi:hypothetical protein